MRPTGDDLVLLGVDELADAELAALALGLSPDQARRWLEARAYGRSRVGSAQLDRRLAAAHALRARLAPRPVAQPAVTDVTSAVAHLHPHLAALEVEELHVLGLDARNRVLGRVCIARGAVNQVTTTAREVFRPLIALGAARAIVAHNHPSGDPEPSEADTELTARLCAAGDLLGVPLVDHIILASTRHHSFASAGGLGPRPRRRGNVGLGIGIR